MKSVNPRKRINSAKQNERKNLKLLPIISTQKRAAKIDDQGRKMISNRVVVVSSCFSM